MKIKNEQKDILIIWDKNEAIPEKIKKNNYFYVFWNGYEEFPQEKHSFILTEIKKNEFLYRNIYLNWIHSLNNIKKKNIDLIDFFKIREDFSFWSMSLFNEKCNFIKSPAINDSIKLIALEDLIKEIYIKKIIIYSSNKHLSDCIEDWCFKNCILFKSSYKKTKFIKNTTLLNIYNFLKAIYWLVLYLYKRWSFRKKEVLKWKNSDRKITFISYLSNLNPKKLKKGNFESNFWGDLPKKLSSNNIRTNWLHIWDPNDQLKDTKEVINKLDQINCKNNKQLHISLDSFLSLNIIKTSILDWFSIIIKSYIFESYFFENSREGFNLAIVQNRDWYETFHGYNGIKNILFFNLLGKAFSCLKQQKSSFYLQENQGWEFGLIAAWKYHQKVMVCGVPHFSIRFWDLRYFFDKNYFYRNIKNLFIRPDKLMINGEVQLKNMLEIGYPKNELIKVEALRYNYLLNEKIEKNHSKKQNFFNILILGDYDNELNQKFLNILEKSLQGLKLCIKIFFKPHPTSFKFELISSFKLTIVKSNLKSILKKTDFVLCGGNSSASLDVIYFGLPLAVLLDDISLNISPINNVTEEYFVKNEKELKSFINKILILKKIKVKKINYFYLDKNIPLWLKFVKKIDETNLLKIKHN